MLGPRSIESLNPALSRTFQYSVLFSNAEALDGYFLIVWTVLNLVIKHQNI